MRGTIPGGNWPRFSRYEVVDGHVRPAPGARLTLYSPWKVYDEERFVRQATSSQEWVPPYDGLIRLAEGLPDSVFPRWEGQAMDEEAAAKVTAFCAKVGLLGLLPHALEALTLHPVWEYVVTSDGVQADLLAPTQRHYYRLGSFFTERIQQYPGGAVPPDATRVGQPVPRGQWPHGFEEPHVLLTSLRRTTPERESLTQRWAAYFPGIRHDERETYQYPLPMSRQFWEQYAEPTRAIVGAGSWLREILGALRGRAKVRTAGVLALNALLARVTPTAARSGDTEALAWSSPSLLGYYALMILQDLVAHRRVQPCETCGHIFLAGGYQTRYCSSRCRWTGQKRRQKAKTRGRDSHGSATRTR